MHINRTYSKPEFRHALCILEQGFAQSEGVSAPGVGNEDETSYGDLK